LEIHAASRQWASRPDDQRFESLTAMSAFAHSVKDRSLSRVISSRTVEARPLEEDRYALVLVTPDGYSTPTNWAFSQLSARADAPASYLKKLPGELAADCLNYGLLKRTAEDIGLFFHNADVDLPTLAAATGPNYGRVHNSNVIDRIIDHFGDGVTGRFKVPGEFGHAVDVTKANTTLYASDRDMFVFLADETNRIEVPNRRAGQPGTLSRGFFVWNSDVGSQTLGVATFLFDFVCCNRIVWGADEYKEIRIRHTTSAPDRWLEEVAPAIESYANASAANIEIALANARAARIEEVEKFLSKRRFTVNQAKAISLIHIQEEGRPIETVWDAVTGITAYAKGIKHQDARIEVERRAGDLLELVK
jgi:hypothetical protein